MVLKIMWLSKKISENVKENKDFVVGKITDIKGTNVSIQSDQEYRDVPFISPFGVSHIPSIGDKVILGPLNSGYVCFGTIEIDRDVDAHPSLDTGEIMISSKGGASVVLKNTGQILINGEVLINGKIFK